MHNLPGFKNRHKYHVMYKTNITLCANVYMCMYVCIYIYMVGSNPNYVNFGLRNKFQKPNLYVTQKLPVYTTPFVTLVIITP